MWSKAIVDEARFKLLGGSNIDLGGTTALSTSHIRFGERSRNMLAMVTKVQMTYIINVFEGNAPKRKCDQNSTNFLKGHQLEI